MDFKPHRESLFVGVDITLHTTSSSLAFLRKYTCLHLSRITSASCTELSEWCAIEYWITLVCLYIGAIFYGILISAISAILQTANKSSQEFDDHLLRIDDYMRSKKLPASMREKMKDYFYLQFSNGKLHKEAEILDFLSPVLRREIKHFTGREICRKVPLLSTPSHTNFAQDISCVIEPTIVFANEVIMRESTTGDEMYFISSGVVEIFVSSIKNVAYLAIGDGCVSCVCLFPFRLCPYALAHTPCCTNDNSTLAMLLSCWASDELHLPNPRRSARSIAFERAALSHYYATIQQSNQK